MDIGQLGGHEREGQRRGWLALIDADHRLPLFVQAMSDGMADQTIDPGDQQAVGCHGRINALRSHRFRR